MAKNRKRGFKSRRKGRSRTGRTTKVTRSVQLDRGGFRR